MFASRGETKKLKKAVLPASFVAVGFPQKVPRSSRRATELLRRPRGAAPVAAKRNGATHSAHRTPLSRSSTWCLNTRLVAKAAPFRRESQRERAVNSCWSQLRTSPWIGTRSDGRARMEHAIKSARWQVRSKSPIMGDWVIGAPWVKVASNERPADSAWLGLQSAC